MYIQVSYTSIRKLWIVLFELRVFMGFKILMYDSFSRLPDTFLFILLLFIFSLHVQIQSKFNQFS